MNFLIFFIVAILIFIIFIYFDNKNREVSYVISNFDNRKYLVHNGDDKQQAADLLAKCRTNLVKVCDYMKERYPNDERIERLTNKFNPNSIVETSPNSKHTSYSINKGEKIVLCLRSRDGQNRLVELNVLMFVALHELAHVATKSIGHTKEFWDNFEFILKEAVKAGVYKHVDFNKHPTKYCGVTITDTPLSK
jgi:predicted metal-dependent hydrolase